jgi:thiamine-monophosphate kinase
MAAFLSLALPGDLEQNWVDRFMRGLLKLASEHVVALAGGDTAESLSGVLADIMVLGSVPRGKAVLRSGARPGDRIYVTGKLGLGGATVARMYGGEKILLRSARHYFFPEPRIEVGQRLRGIASAMIDISDGLSTDLSHICEESGVGAVLDLAAIPVANGARLEDALYGGDDYELLFTSAKRIPRDIAGVAITQIGEVVKRPGMVAKYQSGKARRLKAKGWEHFRR